MSDTQGPDPLARVREGYDRWASVYDHDQNPLPALEEPLVRAAIGEVRELVALDLGCGTGRHTAWLARDGADVTAIDFSEGMLAEAGRAVPGASVRFLVHDLHEPLPFPDATFDLAVSGLVLEHLRDLAAFFGEVRRVLRPNGRAVVSAMHPSMFLRGTRARFMDPASGAVIQPGSLPYQLGDFVLAAVRAGFELENIGEHAPDADFAARYPRAEKYVGWPMLAILELRAAKARSEGTPTSTDAQGSHRISKPSCSEVGLPSDLSTPWCLRVAATLRIAERIQAGTTEIGELAAAAGCDAGALHAVLAHLARSGVFEERSSGRFHSNDTARTLLEPAQRLALDLGGIGGRFAHAWGTLLDYVRTGTPAYEKHFGLPFWEDLDAHPELGASFDALMGPAGHGAPDPDFPIRGGWTSVRSVVDVGGGTGAMLAEILRQWPLIRGTLVDLPRTVALSAETFRAAGVAERARAIGQSFFDPLPGGADLYLLRKVLNDWPDPRAIAILARCAEAARPVGRVVVLGGVVAHATEQHLSIERVLAGGRDRSLAELREIARAAGLAVIAAGRASSGSSVVECRPT